MTLNVLDSIRTNDIPAGAKIRFTYPRNVSGGIKVSVVNLETKEANEIDKVYSTVEDAAKDLEMERIRHQWDCESITAGTFYP